MESHNPLIIIDELESLFKSPRRLFGKTYVPEEAFFVATQKLRAYLSHAGLQEQDKQEIIGIIDEMESLMMQGTGLFGNVGVNKEDFHTRIQKIRLALPGALKKAEEIS